MRNKEKNEYTLLRGYMKNRPKNYRKKVFKSCCRTNIMFTTLTLFIKTAREAF